MIHSDLKEYETALLFFRKSLQLKKNNEEKKSIVSELINISTTLSILERFFESNTTIEEALTMAKSINDIQLIKWHLHCIHNKYSYNGK